MASIPLIYTVRSLAARRTTTIMTAAGVALVTMIFFILSGFVDGLRATLLDAPGADVYVALSRGVDSEPSSYISVEQYDLIRVRPEIASSGKIGPLVSPELVASFDASGDAAFSTANFSYIRGVYPAAFGVHRNIKIVAGRAPIAGTPEMIAGARLAAKFPKLKPGGRIHFGRRDWNVVGVFSDAGSARESEIWTDLNLLAQEIHFGSGFSTLHIAMSPGRIESFSAALSADSRLNLDAMSEREFYSRQTQLADRLGAIAMLVAAIVGVGATFGAMNTMYSAVARRAREIGVLRAIGFGRGAIMLSFMIESIAIALAGGVAGELLAVGVAMGTGLTGRLMTAGTTTFSFRIAPSVFVSGLAAALGIGVAGGLIPAWRAARMRVIESIRAA